MEQDGAVYLATKFNRQQLQAAVQCNVQQMKNASARLQANGRISITRGPNARVFVRQ
jgi:hypothetical protein